MDRHRTYMPVVKSFGVRNPLESTGAICCLIELRIREWVVVGDGENLDDINEYQGGYHVPPEAH